MTKGEYTYNGNGQRVRKITNGQTVYFVFDQQGKLIEELGATITDYVFLNDCPLAKIENGTINYIHVDHLGTPIKMTDAQKQLTWEINVMPFGEMLNITETTTNNLRLPGQYYDAETGLNYNYFRDYNPVIGRYVEVDPVGMLKGRNHMFTYVQNNPINLKDPLGLKCKNCMAEYEDCLQKIDDALQYTLQNLDKMISWEKEKTADAYTYYKSQCQKISSSPLKNACNLAAWAQYKAAMDYIGAIEKMQTFIAYSAYTGAAIGCYASAVGCDMINMVNPCCK